VQERKKRKEEERIIVKDKIKQRERKRVKFYLNADFKF
jgi:hypothetical protein